MEVMELITHTDGTRYLRSGVCDGCKRPGMTPGLCCTFIELPLARQLTPDEVHWVELHPGLTINGQSVHIDTRCSALSPEGDCTLIGSESRPQVCERAPELPRQVLEGCAYTLSEVSVQ